MPKYCPRPIVISALRWDGKNLRAIKKLIRPWHASVSAKNGVLMIQKGDLLLRPCYVGCFIFVHDGQPYVRPAGEFKKDFVQVEG